MATLRGGAFVGRQQEMGKLTAVLKDALSGQGQLLMLVGEPGIGKTRTAQELAGHAETRGAQVLWGWCYEEEGAPPFWPWVQPIRAYIQQRDSEQLQSEMGPGAADTAEVISEVRDKLPGLEPPPALPPEQARFRLFDSITTFLKNAAQSQPLMLVLDDLHWADKPSLLLLQFLAHHLIESHLLVVGCYRDLQLSRHHPLSEALAQLSHLPVFQRELLLGITQEDAGQFIEITAGMRPSPQLVETIHAHTEGNPFFLKEMTRLLSEQGELRAADIGGPEGIRIPQGVREVIGQRLNRLSESCYQALTIASIIGREFDFRLLRTLSDETTEEQLLGVIDEALAARLVEELPGGREHYRFSHSLIQQTLAEELSSSRKARWHARIGEALEELYEADGEAHAAELAYHFAKAEPVLGPDKLVHYSLLAGEGALTAYAYEEALAHFQQGLSAK
jgi:predicted ATPase